MKKAYISLCLMVIFSSCATDPVEPSGNNTPQVNVVCDCPPGNIQGNADDLVGYWSLNKRTILDLDDNVTEVQDLLSIQPCHEDAFHLKVFIDDNNVKIMSTPVGGLLRPAPSNCGQITNIQFPIVYYIDGGSCLKLLTTSPTAGHKLCFIEFTQNTIKVKMKWSQKYYIFECTKQ
jgi:hypothetical protein